MMKLFLIFLMMEVVKTQGSTLLLINIDRQDNTSFAEGTAASAGVVIAGI
jgi:hypothetical protein